MIRKYPGFAIAASILWMALLGALVVLFPPQISAGTLHEKGAPRQPQPAQLAPQASRSMGAAQLLRSARGRLRTQPTISAKVRNRIQLLGQELVGVGSYFQMPSRDTPLLRFEMQISGGEEVTSMLQVSDGRFLWEHRILPGANHSDWSGSQCRRIDLRLVRRAAGMHPDLYNRALGGQPWLALGGLSHLLKELSERFHYTPPQEATLHGVPVWVLRGTWTAEMLREIVPKSKHPEDPADGVAWLSQLPEHLPQAVTLALGQDDLFPYRIHYDRMIAPSDAGELGPIDWKPMMTTEFYEVRFGGTLDPMLFVYRPGDTPVLDDTARLLDQFGISPDETSQLRSALRRDLKQQKWH